MTGTPRPTVAQLLGVARTYPGAHDGHKEMHIRTTLGITPARFYQLLDRAIDTRAAAELDPITTHRLRRERDTRVAARAARA